MKLKNIVYIVLGLSVVGLAYFLLKDKFSGLFKKSETTPSATPSVEKEIVYVKDSTGKEPSPTVAPTADYWNLDHNKILKRGSKGPEVTQLQILMNKALVIAKKPQIAVDGSFGPTTEKVLLSLANVKQISLNQAVITFMNKLTS